MFRSRFHAAPSRYASSRPMTRFLRSNLAFAGAEQGADAAGGGQPGEPRSSSGECTSGESKTEKESEQVRNGSLKDSGSQAGNENSPAENSGEGGGAAPATKLEDSAITNATDDTETPGKAKEEKRPKLPRPEGTCPCPRCASEDTKFCYYNNYNMKQPRYFCKVCQTQLGHCPCLE